MSAKMKCIYVHQMKVLIKSNRMMHVSDQSDKRGRIYGGFKNYFVDCSPNMVLLWSRDQSYDNEMSKV